MSRSSILSIALCLVAAGSADAQGAAITTDAHRDHVIAISPSSTPPLAPDTALPAGAADAAARLAASPRHREWVMISAGGTDSVGAWVVYPERKTKAPVVIVVHEIFGLSTWVRAVGDQLAAQGFIAIVPDMLTGKHIPGGPDSVNVDSAIAVIRTLRSEDVQRRLVSVANYGMHLAAALPRYGIVGFCWGGGVAFAHAAVPSSVSAAVVYYGAAPDSMLIGQVHAPVLGLYGKDDLRIDATVPWADSTLRALGRTYQPELFIGAGHGFLRDQTGRNGANFAATQVAWPETIAWFRKYLEK